MVREKVQVKDARRTLARLWTYLRQQRGGLIFSTLLVVASTLLGLLGPYLMGRAIDVYIIASDLPGLAKILGVLAAIYAATSLTTWWQTFVIVAVAQRTVRDMRKALFEQLETLSLRFFDKRPHGELMSRLTNDVDNISTVLNEAVTQLVSSLLTVIGTAAIMFALSWQMALVSLLTVPVMMLITRTIAARTLVDFRKQQAALGTLNGLIEETVSGGRVIKAYCREETAIAEFDEANKALKSAALHAQSLSQTMGPLMNFVGNLGYAVISAAGGWLALNGLVTVGTIAAFLNYSQQFNRPLNQLATLFNSLQSALAGAERFFEILDEPPEIVDEPGAVALERVNGEVEFDGVTFGYDPEVPVLKNVSLHAHPGQTIALVGPTGAGKTTIINLLSRFYDVDGGEIRVDGYPLHRIRKADLRSRLGVVLQDTYLFATSVMENIRYGRLDATDEEVYAAAKLANADGFIRHLPHGYQTALSEGASNLSQGQRQLLAIARAVLADPGILILDEATSSVDTRTEKHIQEALLRLMSGRTSFVIAHRLSTIRDADCILVLFGGEILERGTHAELLEKKGAYYNLYMSQFKGQVATLGAGG